MKPDILLRSNDPTYMLYVKRYFGELLPLIRPLTYANGGPVILVQVENEYGSYFACDSDYMTDLVNMMKEGLGEDVVLFTTDGAGDGFLICGPVKGAYVTVDFAGDNATAYFSYQRKKEPRGPLVNSEFYPGWLDHWGQNHSRESAAKVTYRLEQMLALNASVNIYMMHGGTSFGYSSGANQEKSKVFFDPTSYDYDAPISEAGDLTDKFMKIRQVIGKYLPVPSGPLPGNSTKIAFGPVRLKQLQPVLSVVRGVPPVLNESPLTFEELGLDQGFVLYETEMTSSLPGATKLSVPGVKDRGYVFVEGVLQGILNGAENKTSLPVSVEERQSLSILVENQGRITVGRNINDFKGIIGDVRLGKTVLRDWRMWPLTFFPAVKTANATSLEPEHCTRHQKQCLQVPAVFQGTFTLPEGVEPADTFLSLEGWHKGVVVVNNFNLGRYWPVRGPQKTLYVPGTLFKTHPESNNITILELESAPCSRLGTDCKVSFVDRHVIDATVVEL